jgi:murein DD-endopeptidase MepM/ murein hydrolase activator NlpD
MRLLTWLLVALAGAIAGYLFTRFEGQAPVIQTSTARAYVSEAYEHQFRVSDEGTGLESIEIWLEAGDKRHDLVASIFPGNLFTGADLSTERILKVSIDPAELGIPDGPAVLSAEAKDFSWGGNLTEISVPLVIDTRPPRISLTTGLTYVKPGGTRVVVYSLGEESQRDGVEVGERFFPGFAHPTDAAARVAFYAFPLEGGDGTSPRVTAVDRAGNEANVGTTIRLIDASMRQDSIQLSESFMEQKVSELLGERDGDLLDLYISINRDMRRENAEKIRELTAESNAERLWRGPFEALSNSERRASFGDRRTYRYQGRDVDRQTHLGLDLASTSHAVVPAGNDGIVAFADDLGIYGRTVIVDHGLGLFSLYAHLSDISVAKGDVLAKGDPLGHTGATGLAGGDHLHFAMLVSGEFVDPLEWLDPKWIQDHVDSRLGGGDPEAAAEAPTG